MKRDKILLNVNNLDDIEKYKKLGITNFLFPLKGYTIGYTDFTFKEIENIDGNVYILMNRLLTDEDIDEFLKLEIPKNVKGFITEDIGIFYELKGKGYELINFQNHLNNNYQTINYWLKSFDSLVISTDITKEEIEEILKNATKPLILNAFGYPIIMYSRRTLVSNYYRHLGKESKKELEIIENISQNNFKLKENRYGTAVFNNQITDYRSIIPELDDSKICYYLINTEFLSFNEVKSAIEGKEIANTTEGFLNKKTIYKVGDIS